MENLAFDKKREHLMGKRYVM